MSRVLTSSVWTAATCLLWIWCTTGAAYADKRVALVIGNSTYQSVPQLANPAQDARAVADMLKAAGFETVELLINAGNLEFKRAIRRFEGAADGADVAVIYYAGHGLEIGGANYLIPVDARLASDRDAEDEAITLSRALESIEGAKKLRLAILDACRDNPFTISMRRERRSASRAVTTGLGRVEPASSDTLIAYAAKAGSTADDGDGNHSPFTRAILKNLPVPGLDIRLAFGRVRDDVLKSTGNRQEPFVYGAIGGGIISLVPAPDQPKDTPLSDVKADFELVQKIGSKKAWEVFLGSHPTGFYADLARAQIQEIEQGAAKLAMLPAQPSPSAPSLGRDALEWARIKDTSDLAVLQGYIRRFPDSPLAITAQQRLDLLKQAAAEREQKERAEREAARLAAAEAARRVALEKAALEAQRKRDVEERLAAAARAAQQAKAAEFERKAQQAREQAERAERDHQAALTAAARSEAERQAREAEQARKNAELAEAKEAACKNEQSRLDQIVGKGSEGSGLDDLKALSKTLTCTRLGSVVVATMDRFSSEAAQRAAAQPNSPQLVKSAQIQLARLGCMGGRPDGSMDDRTKTAIRKFRVATKSTTAGDDISVTAEFVADLTNRTDRACPVECRSDETLKDDVCVPESKPIADSPARRKPEAKSREEKSRRERIADRPGNSQRSRVQAAARPASSGGGGHGLVGVGF